MEVVREKTLADRIRLLKYKLEGLKHFDSCMNHLKNCELCHDLHKQTYWVLGVVDGLMNQPDIAELMRADPDD